LRNGRRTCFLWNFDVNPIYDPRFENAQKVLTPALVSENHPSGRSAGNEGSDCPMRKITIDTAGASPEWETVETMSNRCPFNAYTVRDFKELHGFPRMVSRADGAIEA
jgi:hypothetical protein